MEKESQSFSQSGGGFMLIFRFRNWSFLISTKNAKCVVSRLEEKENHTQDCDLSRSPLVLLHSGTIVESNSLYVILMMKHGRKAVYPWG